MIGLTHSELLALSPYSNRAKAVTRLLGGANAWDGNKIDAAKAKSAGVTFDDLVWVAAALSLEDEDIERRLRLWMADCAARVLHVYEKQAPTDMRVRQAIIVSRQFARGEVTDAAWDAAWDAEETWQFDHLVLWLSDDEPQDWPLPEVQS